MFLETLVVLMFLATIGLSVFIVHVSKTSMKNLADFTQRLMDEHKDRESETWKRALVEVERHRGNEQDAISKLLQAKGRSMPSPAPANGSPIHNGAVRSGVPRRELAIGV